MANLNLTNFIVDRVLAGVGFRGDDSIAFKLDQCQNTSITCGSEATDIVDNVGAPIMTLYRAKTCEISGENAILDFNMTAFQMGTEKTVAGKGAAIVAPALETFVAPEGGKYELKHAPVTLPKFIYTLNKDQSLGEKYAMGTGEEANKAITFAYEQVAEEDGTTKHVLTLPTDVEANTEMFVSYEYASEEGIEIVNSAKSFPKSVKLVLKVLGYNPCDKDNMLGAYIIFPSFEMSPDFDLSLNVGEAQSWSGKASQDFCSKDKKLMSIVVVDDEDTFDL